MDQVMKGSDKKDQVGAQLLELINKLQVSSKVDEPVKSDPSRNIFAKVCEMQEAVEIYERLNLKSEYIYSYRMLILLLL